MDLAGIISYQGRADLVGIDPKQGERAYFQGKLKSTFLDQVSRVADERTPSRMAWRIMSGEQKWRRYVIEEAWDRTTRTLGDWQNYVSYAREPSNQKQ